MLKIYQVDFNGRYLEGSMLVIEETQRKAFNKAKKEVERLGLTHKNENFNMSNLIELSLDSPEIILITDGDY